MSKTGWLKINFHMHTTVSDGHCTPEDAIGFYRDKGYDIVALTDHWKWNKSGEIDGMRVISGAEFNTNHSDAIRGVYHILGIGCERDPQLDPSMPPQQIIDGIRAAGGLAVLAHPAWSINTTENVAPLHGLEATEIFNSVSQVHESGRAYSGEFVDASACKGVYYPLLATDDTHYYDGDQTCGWIMLEGDLSMTDAQILDAVRAGRFYATQGPELYAKREDGKIVVDCSPVDRIMFHSNLVWAAGHGITGKGMTHAEMPIHDGERYVRVEIIDSEGKHAWSNIFVI